jgi:endonuclease III
LPGGTISEVSSSPRRIRALHRRLKRQHGSWRPKVRQPPLDELVGTVLSQHTSDVNSGRAFATLKERFPSWDQVLAAPTEEVADAIRSGGIATIKARRIQRILAEIEQREGCLDLSRLERLSDEEADVYLRSLTGVGPKTAACVLLFSLGRAAFPIDTHVHRVSARLGLVSAKATAEQAHYALAPRVPPELRYEFHVQLISHGRLVCRPRRPLCTECVLFDLCEAGPRLLAAGEAV